MSQEKIIGTHMTMSMSEMFYMLFRKKECPECGAKMKKLKMKKIVHSSEIHNWNRRGVANNAGNVRLTYYEFGCASCSKRFPLSYLAGRGKG